MLIRALAAILLGMRINKSQWRNNYSCSECLVASYPVTNFEAQNNYHNNSKFNGVYSINNLYEIKNGVYIINIDE